MRTTLSSLFLVSLPLASGYTPASTSASDLLAAQSLANLNASVADGTLAAQLATKGVSQTCTIETAAVRREYSTLSNDEKLEYTNAVKCLMAKDPITPLDLAPGVRSRYDDFVATHINQTWSIHACGAFLSWHRYFTWTFEQALRDECGYTGYLPYWNWGKSALDPINSPYLDGSEYSQGGNGVYEAHNATQGLPSGLLPIEPGVGGGCVETGPYAGVLANISATGPTWPTVEAGVELSYGPRCIRHDISVPLANEWATDDHTVDLLSNPSWQTDIAAFQDRLQYTGNDTVGYYSLHQYGHFSVTGDPSGDVYNSPNEPLFWLHHGNIDRMWWVWQNQQPIERAFQIGGTRTMLNTPPSDNATIDDLIDLGVNAGASAISQHTTRRILITRLIANKMLLKWCLTFLALCISSTTTSGLHETEEVDWASLHCPDDDTSTLPTPTYGTEERVWMICTELIINAPLQTVYDTLIDYNNYPVWNSFVVDIQLPANDIETPEGVYVGLKMVFTSTGLFPGINATSNELVTVLDDDISKGYLLNAWRSNEIFNGSLSRAEHPNILTDAGQGRTRYVSYETYYEGIATPLIYSLKANLQAGWDKQGQDLIAYLEG
ncbi:hypothetical protein SCUP234_11542 [Seiridium cupressi]